MKTVLQIMVSLLMLLTSAACARLTSFMARPTPPPAVDALATRFLASAPLPLAEIPTPTPAVSTGLTETTIDIPLPLVEPLTVDGAITVVGSEALVPLTTLMYEQFVDQGYQGTIMLEESKTATALQLFCETTRYDIVNTNRPLKVAELDLCLQNGRQPVALRVGLTAVVIVVNPANKLVEDITSAELVTLFSARRWSDVRTDWPSENILRYVPPPDADLTSFFADLALGGNARLLTTASNTSFISDYLELIQGIAEQPYAVGLLPYDQYQNNRNALKLVALNGVQPEAAAIYSGDYLLSGPLLLYIEPQNLQSKPQVGAFLAFYLTLVNQLIAQVAQIALPPPLLNQSKVNLLVALDNQAYLQELTARLTPVATAPPTAPVAQETPPPVTPTPTPTPS